MPPAISVIVPVLNTRPYLRQCLDSLAVQTLQEIEVICVDNGSTDGSYEFLQEYTERHANMTVLRHTEGRQGGARNFGMGTAKGEYIGFVDSDDFVAPTMFQKMYDAAQRGCADMAVCNIEFYYEGNGHGSQALPDDLLVGGEPISIQQRPKLLRNLTICNKIFARELIERHKIRFPAGVFHEDQLFVIAAFVLARRIVTVPEALYFYRRERPGSVNENRGPDSLQIFQVMQMVSDLIDSKGLDGSFRLLMNEVKALKYLQLYQMTGSAFKKKYFERMRSEFQDLPLTAPPHILSLTERREFQFVQSHGYALYNLFLWLRKIYRSLRGHAKSLSMITTRAKASGRIGQGK